MATEYPAGKLLTKLAIVLIFLVVLVGTLKCYKSVENINPSVEQVMACSTAKLKSKTIDSENMFDYIYGTYIFKDSLEGYQLNISPTGKYYAMKEFGHGVGHEVEIYGSGYLVGEVKNNKMYIYSDSTLLLSGEIYYCDYTLIDASTLVKGHLMCKCII